MRHVLLLVLSALLGVSSCVLIQKRFFATSPTKTDDASAIRATESDLLPQEPSPVRVIRGATDAELEQMAELRLRVEVLLTTVEALQIRQSEFADARNHRRSGDSMVSRDETQTEDSPNSERDGREQWEELRHSLHAQVDESEPDPDRAAFATDEIFRRLAAEPDDRVSLQDVSCGTTVCRIRLRVAEDTHASSQTEPILPDFLPWEGEALIEEDERDPTRLIVYLAREGETLTPLNTSNQREG